MIFFKVKNEEKICFSCDQVQNNEDHSTLVWGGRGGVSGRGGGAINPPIGLANTNDSLRRMNNNDLSPELRMLAASNPDLSQTSHLIICFL